MKILRASLAGVEGTLQQLLRAGGESALPTIFQWSELLGQPVPDDVKKSARRAAETPNAKAFAQLVERGKALKKAVLGKEGLAAAEPFVAELRQGPAPMSEIYADRLNAQLAGGDPAQVAALLDSADVAVPARWLALKFFRW